MHERDAATYICPPISHGRECAFSPSAAVGPLFPFHSSQPKPAHHVPFEQLYSARFEVGMGEACGTGVLCEG